MIQTAPHIAIDKDVPLPIEPRQRVQYWPFPDLEVGESFVFMPCADARLSMCRAGAARIHWQKKLFPRKFACRTMARLGKRYVRIWRIA